jgi:hypothetical protein
MAVISEEDKSLLVVAVLCEDDTGVIHWNDVKRYLSGSSSCQELKDRFETLKSTNAVLRSNVPREYFKDSCIDHRASVYHAIEEVLGGIRRSDIKQPSGKANLNSGEIAPVGISQVLDAVEFSKTDIFVDVGSGTGNVVVQIALESKVPCYGIEIRDELATRSRREIKKFAEKYPSLDQVTILSDNVRTLSPEHFKLVQDCTILYSSNGLFDPLDNIALQDFILSLPKLTTVILSSPFCWRCGVTCTQSFCLMWRKTGELFVQPTWTKKKIKLNVFNRNDNASLLDHVMRM